MKRILVLTAALGLPGLLGLPACTQDHAPPGPPSAREQLPVPPAHTDHSGFFDQPFADGPAVTRACLECHPDEAREIMATAHWNWQGQEVLVPGHDEPMRIGKRNVINNFCIGIQSNWPACTQCHIGYGWEDENFDFEDPSRVDCLVCHDNSGMYKKAFRGAGRPDEAVDLLAAARSVARPTRKNCGGCHFQGGGDNAVKHGDLDNTLLFPSARIDVHMGSNDMQCVDCHLTRDHTIVGRAITVSVDRENRLRCSGCHPAAPHQDVRLNAHTERLACQTCHIPFMAVDTGTKMSWDWSQAGQDLDITDAHLYINYKGRFTWAKKLPPEYYWYNETSTRYILGDEIDPSRPTRISGPLGDRTDPEAKIWPFKVHRGKQVYDTVNRYFLVPHVHGEQGFWTQLDWPKALELGSRVTGLPFSGLYDFAPTEMFMPQTHMITEADQALQCRDCHGERGRLDWLALGYPGDPLTPEMEEHPPIYLFDANGEPVSSSGEPLSIGESCSICHELEDPAFVATHGYHTSVKTELLPPERRPLMVHGPRISQQPDEQMNCFLCHIQQPNHAARLQAIGAGEPEWSVSATLLGSGLLETGDDGYAWDTERVAEDGEAELALRRVSETNCGTCHGLVHDGAEALTLSLGDGRNWTTEKTGQIFSPQRIARSALNLRGKDQLDLAWDVHSERLVSCGDCHYSQGRPERLAGEAQPAQVEPAGGVRRRCQSCHALEGSHQWLPEPERHFNALACEACHVPALQMAAQQAIDASVGDPEGRPLVSYRGLDRGDPTDLSHAYVSGYRPLLQVGQNERGELQVLPYNLVARWYWADGPDPDGAPVSAALTRRAWLGRDGYHPEVAEAFDSDRDGALSSTELRLDNYAKVVLIKERLRDLGVANPTLRGELRAYHIHHNVRHGDRVNRECARCHPETPQDLAAFELAPYVPGRVLPELVADPTSIRLDGELQIGADGRLWLQPALGPAASYQALRATGD